MSIMYLACVRPRQEYEEERLQLDILYLMSIGE